MDKENLKSQEAAAERQTQLAADYQRTFSGDYGERVLMDLLEYSGMLRSSFALNQRTGVVDALEMAFREGERAMALRILDIMNIDVKKFKALVKERIENESKAY